jgi:hypothetical protein
LDRADRARAKSGPPFEHCNFRNALLPPGYVIASRVLTSAAEKAIPSHWIFMPADEPASHDTKSRHCNLAASQLFALVVKSAGGR